jgi:uncharacterized protein YdaU (DUF1376 family)
MGTRRQQTRGEIVNHYPRHVGDITQATFGLSLTEFGAYDRLLDAYYASEKPLPLEAGERYRLAGAVSKSDREAVDYVVRRYFSEEEDGWHQKRADAEIAMYRVRADTARENGAKGGRRPNPEITQSVLSGIAKPNPEKPKGQSNPEPVAITSKAKATPLPPKPMLGADAPHGVRPEVWEAWRRHKGKKLTADALRLQSRTIARAIADGHDPNAMIEASIANGWAGLFPPKVNGHGPPNIHEKRAATARAMFGNLKGGNDDAIDGTAERVV